MAHAANATGGLSPEAKAGLLLAGAAAVGVAFENIGFLKPFYDAILGTKAVVAVGEIEIAKPLLLWINDGLMAVFFLLVALEIKREAKEGALSSWKQASLPVYSAVGGMAAPALVFIAIVGFTSAEAKGWAIPAATDIAFALGVLSLFGNRVPPSLKTFLLALAVVDDLGAIVIIAIFYTAKLSVTALTFAAAFLAILALLNALGVKKGAPYVIVGILLWVCVLKSGVHATLAGVALGFAIPLEADKNGRSLAQEFEHGLHKWVALAIMPIFAFANAGVPLYGLSPQDMTAPLTIGVAAGLFIGKQIGVFGAAWGAIRLGLALPPAGARLIQLYAVSLLAGIGFTMSLFIGTLGFEDQTLQNQVRLGVIAGSLTSGVLGALILGVSGRRPMRAEAPAERPQPSETTA